MTPSLKAGVHLKPVFPPLNLFKANISSAFQVIQKLYAHLTKLCLAFFFFNFWVILGDVWEEILFLKVLIKFGEIINIKDLTTVPTNSEVFLPGR